MDSSREEGTSSPYTEETLLKHYVPFTTEKDTSSFSSPSSLPPAATQAASAMSIDLTRPTFRSARVVHGRRPGVSMHRSRPRGFESHSEYSRPRKFESSSEQFKPRKFESSSEQPRKFESSSEQPRKFESYSEQPKPKKFDSPAFSDGTMSTLSLKRDQSGESPSGARDEASGIVYSVAKVRRLRRNPDTPETPKQRRKSETKGRRTSDPLPPGFKKVYKTKRLVCPFRLPGRCREDYVKEYLKFHVWDTHFDVRFYRCEECLKPLIQELDVRNHMKQHH